MWTRVKILLNRNLENSDKKSTISKTEVDSILDHIQKKEGRDLTQAIAFTLIVKPDCSEVS